MTNRESQPDLVTERLTLSELTENDTAFILAIYNDPDFLENVGDRGLRTTDDAIAFVEDSPATQYKTFGFGLCRVALNSDGTSIGMCGILKRDHLEYPDLGFAFLPQYRAQGYAYEASMESQRRRLADILGLRDDRVAFDGLELMTTTELSAKAGQGAR